MSSTKAGIPISNPFSKKLPDLEDLGLRHVRLQGRRTTPNFLKKIE